MNGARGNGATGREPQRMFRVLLLGGLLVAVGGLVVLAPQGPVAAALAAAVPMLAVAALVVSVAALVVAADAWRRAAAARNDMLRLAASVDRSMRDIAIAGQSEPAVQSRIAVNDVPPLAQESGLQPDPIPVAEALAPRQIAELRSRLGKGIAPSLLDAGGDEAGSAMIGRAVNAALDSGEEFDISLQPIISIAQRETIGFELFARLKLDDGSETDLQRLESADRDTVRQFEAAMVEAGLVAARRRLGTRSQTMPCHIALSSAFLSHAESVRHLADTLSVHPASARSIILSVTPQDAASPDGSAGMQTLAASGARFCLEGWEGDEIAPANVVSHVKLPADRLLDRLRLGYIRQAGSEIVQAVAAAQLMLIATGVASDDDAGRLFEMGVDAMCGPHFAEPRPLRPAEGHDRPDV